MDHTPGSKFQESFSNSSSVNQSPATPKCNLARMKPRSYQKKDSVLTLVAVPFDPPRRRSSLAFSKIIDSPQSNAEGNSMTAAASIRPDQTPVLRPIVNQQKTVEVLSRYSGVPPGHVAQIQKVFQTARANLQFDMHFAASPVGSIDARLPQTSEETNDTQTQKIVQPRGHEKSWRYSTVPQLFTTISMDVREPVPDASPPLPAIDAQRPNDTDVFLPFEPTSSGFASPVSGGSIGNDDVDMALPPLPCSSPSSHTSCSAGSRGLDGLYSAAARDTPDLTEPMTGLKVGSDIQTYEDVSSDCMDDSPIVDHLRRRSDGQQDFQNNFHTFPNHIFLSQSARAAAESAKAKREVLKQIIDNLANKDSIRPGNRCPDPLAHRTVKVDCPDPDLHHYLAATPCPDPFIHVQARVTDGNPSYSSGNAEVRSRTREDERPTLGSNLVLQSNSTHPRRRTTAAGSPMPFTKRAFSPPCGMDDTRTRQPRWMSSPPRQLNEYMSGNLPSAPQHRQKSNENFNPKWHYPSLPTKHLARPTMNLYSFSTAAAKATGESAAPDLRIRDSYRTDTLTPLALPPGRFRRTGLGATLQDSRSRKYYHNHGLAPRLVTRRGATGQRGDDLREFRNLQTRSSPPLPSSRPVLSQNTRKRGFADAGMPEFNISENSSIMSYGPDVQLRQSEEVMQINDETRAAVRMSIFGPNTPEYLHGAREGIRELSPNVNIWRKGLQAIPHYRKKRRPSYWDGDLEAVRMSPAGRGGMASSPPLSKRSMVAELEVMSNRADTIVHDDEESVFKDTNMRGPRDGEKVMSVEGATINKTDAVEMEA